MPSSPLAAGDAPSTSGPGPAPAAPADDDDRVFLVQHRWWREAQEGAGIDAHGVPYAAAPSGPPSYGIRGVISMLMSDNAAFTLRRADDLLQPEASAKAGARSYALVAADLFGKARTWHSDSLKSNGKSSLLTEEASVNIYPIMLRVSVARGTNALTVKISRKDNSAENFKKANKILASESEPVHIWDFSGRTTFILMNEWNRMPQDPRSSDQEMPLEIQFYDISEPPANGAAGRKDELALTMCSSALSNGGIMDMDLDSSGGICKQVGSGLIGLDNLGNTCFMNSAVQCLAHTSKLVDYFLGDYQKEINTHNPLGMKGELAYSFGDLVRKLWAIDGTSFSPRQFKARLARFAPQFSGFNQHDSQELLAFLLDGLHEDLNRVKCKPYAEAKDSDGRPDEEVADEYWGNHLARNDSIIVDTCQGQYKSTLVCPLCKKVSITFDPFMYLSLPLPSTTMRTMTVTVFSTDGSIGPSPYTVSIPKSGDFKTLINALSNACSLRDDERLLVAEVYNSSLIRYLEDPSDDISLIRDGDKLVAYRLPKDSEGAPVVVFKSERMESSISSFGRKSWKNFGTPLVSNLPDTIDGRTIYNLLLKALTPFRASKDDALDADQITGKSSPVNETSDIDMSSDAAECSSMNTNAGEDDMTTEGGMLFSLNTERFPNQRLKIEMDQAITLSNLQKRLIVSVSWQDNGLKQYNLDSLDSLPEVYKTVLFTRRPQETCSLYACLEAFIKEEPLGPEDMWYCPGCKEHRQASKKLDLWRLPEILIIHLKRFSYSRYTKNKLDTYVDFPIHDLDLSSYIRDRSGQMSNHYQLYAVSNHYGSMGGGHYTAYVYNDGKKKWYDFDDRCVSGLENEDSIKTSAAYVLFYRRVHGDTSLVDTETTIESTDCTTSDVAAAGAAMYNGIGLQTARGSGTNGYVQTNKFFIRPRTDGAAKAPLHNYDHDPARDKLGGMRPPNKEILEHDRRRQVELRLVELRDTLEEQGYTEGEIEERVEEARKEAELEAAAAAVAAEAGGRAGGGGPAARPGEGFTGTQSHHVAARKEKQLETLRAALGLEAEIEQKKAEVDSDPESGELVPGKDSEGMDIDFQNDRKAKKHAKKGKKEKGNDRKSHSRSSRKSKHGYDSEDDSESDHDERKGKKHIKKSFLDRDVDSEIVHKKAKQGKGTRHDSEADSDSDHDKKAAKHTKSNRDEGKKGPLKSSRHDSKDEKPRRGKYKDDSYSDSESDVSDSDSGSDSDRKLKKSSYHGSKNDKQAPKSKEKEASLGKNVDKRKRHDSDSDGSAHDRKIHLDGAVVRKDHSRDKPKIDPRSDEHKNKRPVKTSRHDSEDEKPHSKVLRKEKYTGEPEIDSERYTSEKKKPAKSSNHVSKADKDAPKHKEKEGKTSTKNVDKRTRHDSDSDSDSDSDGWQRRLDAKVKKIVEAKKRVISSSESSFYSSSSSSESDVSDDSRENRKSDRGLKSGNDQKYAKRASYKNELEERKKGQDGRRKDLEYQKHKEEERMEQEKQKQREEERKELEKQKHLEEERKELEKQKQRAKEEETLKEREHERRKGDHGMERDSKRKVGEDRYDPNSNRLSDDENRDRKRHEDYGRHNTIDSDRYDPNSNRLSDDENRDRKRHEEYGRHRARYSDSHDSKRSRYDDSYNHSRRDYEERYSRDEHRDRRHR